MLHTDEVSWQVFLCLAAEAEFGPPVGSLLTAGEKH